LVINSLPRRGGGLERGLVTSGGVIEIKDPLSGSPPRRGREPFDERCSFPSRNSLTSSVQLENQPVELRADTHDNLANDMNRRTAVGINSTAAAGTRRQK